MLRITVGYQEPGVTIELSGRVGGVWVNELEVAWREAVVVDSPPVVVVDLTQVSSIDAIGKELLARMSRRGARLVGGDCLIRASVEEIERKRMESSAQS